jgi:anthranilate synthase/aminodeoxychorismate synthase-like glutamine amidotransferase
VILLIDNYDSFTYNLVQLLREAGCEVEVVRNDVEEPAALVARRPAGIVLSPGPGRPEGAGICLRLIQAGPEVPLLGVCLGHQCLGVAFGAVVERAPVLMHGKISEVSYRPNLLMEGLPNPFEATRYHSLVVREDSLPAELQAVAWCDDTTVMALRHRKLPYWGVQFHPESILTMVGPALLRNFLRLCYPRGELPKLEDRRRGIRDRRQAPQDRRRR